MPSKDRIFVKICGITRAEDALAAIGCGADAIGFIAYPKSKRFIPPGKVSLISQSLKTEISKVAVFVNPSRDDIEKYVSAGADVVQLHGDETADFAENVAKSAEVWKAIRPRSKDDILKYKGFPAAKFLIDAAGGTEYGGTGRKSDWELAKFAVEILGAPVILAGGLNPANIAEAISSVEPFGVDLSSGVESSPGIKDHAKLKDVFREIKKGAAI